MVANPDTSQLDTVKCAHCNIKRAAKCNAQRILPLDNPTLADTDADAVSGEDDSGFDSSLVDFINSLDETQTAGIQKKPKTGTSQGGDNSGGSKDTLKKTQTGRVQKKPVTPAKNKHTSSNVDYIMSGALPKNGGSSDVDTSIQTPTPTTTDTKMPVVSSPLDAYRHKLAQKQFTTDAETMNRLDQRIKQLEKFQSFAAPRIKASEDNINIMNTSTNKDLATISEAMQKHDMGFETVMQEGNAFRDHMAQMKKQLEDTTNRTINCFDIIQAMKRAGAARDNQVNESLDSAFEDIKQFRHELGAMQGRINALEGLVSQLLSAPPMQNVSAQYQYTPVGSGEYHQGPVSHGDTAPAQDASAHYASGPFIEEPDAGTETAQEQAQGHQEMEHTQYSGEDGNNQAA
nr:hypothetical protein CFP56_77640 [Quercus suber]